MSSIIAQPRYSCALAAQQSVLAIPRGIPIVHAGPGCSQKAYQFASTGAGFQGEGYAGGNNVPSTNSSEQEVVFGGEDALHKEIEATLKIMKGDLFVALSGCTSDIVGDDTIQVAKNFAREGYPIVGVETAGFKGSSYYGHEAVVNSIIEQFVGNVEPKIKKGLVNVFSIVPGQDPFWRGDLENLKNLLEKIGLEVNILFGYRSEGVEEWKRIPHAEFNLLISPWVGLSTVRLLQKKYNTPFYHYKGLPIGAKQTSSFLRSVGEFAGIDKEKIEFVIKQEEARYYEYFLGLADFILAFRNNLPHQLYTVADSAYAISVSEFLVKEAGFIPEGVYIIDNPNSENENLLKEVIHQTFGEKEDKFIFENDGELIYNDILNKIGSSNKALILGSDWERDIATDTKNLFTYLSLPIHRKIIVSKTYVGYDGALQLLEDIYSLPFNQGEFTSNTQRE
jgi:Nitrogenase molybdenum-iron protein, alpha and beta chains